MAGCHSLLGSELGVLSPMKFRVKAADGEE
jgi:hypothetical protein